MALLTALAMAVGLLLTLLWSAEVEAEHPNLFAPGPAGSVWMVAAGYNTPTHVDNDPYAVDIVRTDAETAGTPVLAPISGTLGHVSADSLSIRDEHGNSVLMSHLFPVAGLERGVVVRRGQNLGVVAPAGEARNNGLSHIHLAVSSRSRESGERGIALIGEYAIEGRDLPVTTEFNAHSGVSFVSTNALQVFDAEFLYPGWNLVGWLGTPDASEATASIRGSFEAVYAFSGVEQSFKRYAPDVPSALSDLTSFAFGDGLLIFVTAPDGVVWQRPMTVAPRSVELGAGYNLVAWSGDARSVAEATGGLGDALLAIYAFDAASQRFESYRPGSPSFLNELEAISPGQAVWVEVSAPAVWEQR